MRDGGHHPGRQAHQPAHRRRQWRATTVQGVVGVARLVFLHLRHDGARGGVAGRQAVHVAGQVRLDLALGLDHETQAQAVAAQAPGQQTDAEGAGVPERVEQRGAVAQLVQALARPGQVIGFLARGGVQVAAQLGIGRAQRLRRVKRLRAHLADVIDSHQRAG